MSALSQIRSQLKMSASDPSRVKIFFKTGAGQYAEHDRFMGVPVPMLRKIAKEFSALSEKDWQTLMTSPINEERFLALIFLTDWYQRADKKTRVQYHDWYCDHLAHVNNWNLVDASAHLIIGAHLFERDRKPLLRLAKSDNMWFRRVAMVATWYFIRKDDLDWTFKLAEILLQDEHDLMHKAVGWMLREAGKRDVKPLVAFLKTHKEHMPRTMLRYAIEKFPEAVRKQYLQKA
jgi:3-methyladenine DNA glycosylase AlkD